jgi:hypothetical protein
MSDNLFRDLAEDGEIGRGEYYEARDELIDAVAGMTEDPEFRVKLEARLDNEYKRKLGAQNEIIAEQAAERAKELQGMLPDARARYISAIADEDVRTALTATNRALSRTSAQNAQVVNDVNSGRGALTEDDIAEVIDLINRDTFSDQTALRNWVSTIGGNGSDVAYFEKYFEAGANVYSREDITAYIDRYFTDDKYKNEPRLFSAIVRHLESVDSFGEKLDDDRVHQEITKLLMKGDFKIGDSMKSGRYVDSLIGGYGKTFAPDDEQFPVSDDVINDGITGAMVAVKAGDLDTAFNKLSSMHPTKTPEALRSEYETLASMRGVSVEDLLKGQLINEDGAAAKRSYRRRLAEIDRYSVPMSVAEQRDYECHCWVLAQARDGSISELRGCD